MSAVAKRLVLYLAGFDSRGARFYHPLYQAEAAKQALLSDYSIAVGDQERIADHVVRWTIRWTDRSASTQTEYLFCEWGDIVRQFWIENPARLLWATLSSSFRLLRAGIFARALQWSWPFGVTMAMPSVLAILFLALSVAALAGLTLAFGTTGLAAGLIVVAALALLAVRLNRKFNCTWVGRALNFFVSEADGRTPELVARRDEFADLLAARLAASKVDEILIVGHSYGTLLAVSVVARTLARIAHPAPRLSLLTLGQTVPMLAWIPQARTIRDEVAFVARSEAVDWVDFSAPSDGACFAFVDPFTALGDRDSSRSNPKLLNPKFHESLAPSDYARHSRDWKRIHFQYILATAKPAEYDYFAITAGNRTLAERFAHRPSTRRYTRLRLGRTRQVQ